METVVVVLDGLILGWLVFTWFYEGNHRKCAVDVTCSACGHKESHKCTADPRNKDAR